MTSAPHYVERVSSRRTEALFVLLTLLFLLLFIWRASVRGAGGWAVVFACFFAFFLFYSLNYRTLIIRLSEQALQLNFGLFTWNIPLENVEACFADKTSLWRIGGAGIHFTWLGGRYRAMFNFLEHPRLVIALKIKKGPVRDIAFSTRRPDELMRLILEGASRSDAGRLAGEARY
jgi:Ca2+/Na+ antiporter